MCGDPKRLWYPQRSTCYATREKEAALAKYQALHAEATVRVWHNGDETSWSKERDDSHPYRYDMGVTVWVAERDVNPDDDFLSQSDPLDGEVADEGSETTDSCSRPTAIASSAESAAKPKNP